MRMESGGNAWKSKNALLGITDRRRTMSLFQDSENGSFREHVSFLTNSRLRFATILRRVVLALTKKLKVASVFQAEDISKRR